jgi:hypothetical protein
MTATTTSAFAQMLSTAPGSCSAIRKELEEIYGLKVGGGTFTALWKCLVKYFGTDGAVTAKRPTSFHTTRPN